MIKMLRRLFSFHLKYKKWVIISYLCTILLSISTSIYPFFYKFFIETVTDKNLDHLPVYLGLFVLVVFISSILDPITWWTFDKYIIASMRDARAFIFKYVQDQFIPIRYPTVILIPRLFSLASPSS